MLVLNIFYQIFIAPIEMGMEWFLEFSFSKTGSYGWSLVLLSVAVNIVLLPLYNLAEKWQQEERDKQGRMANKLKEIKEAFKGQERFMMLQTLYRQNDYHPLLAARNSIGFLIQIPFFFAAFHLLSNYAPLNGQSFGVFADLGKADGLISLGSWQIHIMPFVMTAVNLASAYIYTTELAKKDKIQLYAFALFFLVVLYTSPVALVFYWTINNVFSLGKNWAIKIAKKQINNTIEKSFFGVGRYNLHFLFFFVVACLVSLYIQINVDLKVSVDFYTYFIFTLLGVVFSINQLYLIRSYNKLGRYFFGVLTVVLTIAYFAKLYKLEQRPMQFLLFLNLFIVLGIIISAKAFNLLNLRIFNFNSGQYNSVAFKVAASLFGLVFLVNPFIFFLDEEDLSVNAFELVNLSLNYYVLFTLGFLLIYKVAAPAIKKVIISFLISYAVIYLVLAYVLPVNYGDLENFIFNDTGKLATSGLQDFSEVVFYLGVFLFSFLTINKFKKIYETLASALAIFFVVSIAFYFPYDYFKINHEFDSAATYQFSNDLVELYEMEKKTTLSFSDEKNILVIVLDGYSSGSFSKVLQEEPSIANMLAGFTWYKNTLSTGTSTAASFIALNGGHKYTVESINQRDSKGTIYEEAMEAFNKIPVSLNKLNWKVNYSKPQYIGTKGLNSHLFGFIEYDYRSYLLNNYEEYKEINSKNSDQLMKNEVIKLVMVSNFRGAPLFLRKNLYDNGHWHSHNEGAGTLKAINYKAFDWGLLTALEEDINFSSDKSTFKYLWLEIPHRPNAVNENGLLSGVTTNYIESKQVILKLLKIFEKFKEAGHYSNTKIIIASDHGLSGQPTVNFPANFNSLVPSGYESKMNTGRVNPLLLIKEFNNFEGKLETSNLLMSNADLPSLICSEFENNCGIDDQDPTKHINLNRTLRVSTIVRDEFLDNENFTITDSYEVKNVLFDPNNWNRVE